MATSTITGVIVNSAGTPLQNVLVKCRLYPRPAYITATSDLILVSQEDTTDSNGEYSFVLTETADITPDDSYYIITEHVPERWGGQVKHVIQVGAGDATVLASLVSTPPSPQQAVYLTQAAADARYMPLAGGMGAGSDMIGSRPNDAANGGSVNSAARIDHVHERETVYGTDAERLALTGDELYPGKLFRTTNLNQRQYVRRKDGLGNYNWYEQSDHWRVADATARDALPDPNEGSLIWQADTDELWVAYGSGSENRIQIATTALSDHTPTVAQGATGNISKTTTYSKYKVISGVCHWWFVLAITGAGTVGQTITLSIPVTAAQAGLNIGNGLIYDASVPIIHSGAYELTTTDLIAMQNYGSTGAYVGASPTSFALANSDAIRGYVCYPVTTV